MTELRRRAEPAGRDPASLTVDLVQPPATMERGGSVDDFLQRLPGPERLDEYRDLGLHRLLLPCPSDDLDVLERALDALASSHFGAFLGASRPG